jgi:hypothetical protein
LWPKRGPAQEPGSRKAPVNISDADVAQLVEQPIRNRQVIGSSPIVGSSFPSAPKSLSALVIATINIFDFRNGQYMATVPSRCGPVFLKGGGMKKLSMLAALGLVVLVSLSVAAQDVPKPQDGSKTQHVKAIRISGKVSDDGTRFVQDTNQKVWLVSNLETLKGYEGQQAVLRGRIEDTNKIQVLSIRSLGTYTANSGDSAFRR